jgi:hypothetical protein
MSAAHLHNAFEAATGYAFPLLRPASLEVCTLVISMSGGRFEIFVNAKERGDMVSPCSPFSGYGRRLCSTGQ